MTIEVKLEEIAIKGYHAHIYYDDETKQKAQLLRETLDKQFGELIQLGRWHDRPVGPHPENSYQVKFSPEQFSAVVPWLMLHQNGLTVLIHPETGNDLIDHRDYALWLGKSLALNLDVLS